MTLGAFNLSVEDAEDHGIIRTSSHRQVYKISTSIQCRKPESSIETITHPLERELSVMGGELNKNAINSRCKID